MYCPGQTDVGFDLHFKINYNKIVCLLFGLVF